MADLRKWAADRSPNRPVNQPKDQPELHPDEKKALFKLRREARNAGATLHSDGKGGLPPSLVLGVMRRDEFTCVECKGDQDLQVHHKAGVVSSRKLSKMGHANRPDAIETICAPCHDRVHEKAKKKGIDSSQILPEADVGTKRDHGQPVAYANE